MAMEGVASIALLPCGSVSGHFIQLPHSICYGLHGTGMLHIHFPNSLSAFGSFKFLNDSQNDHFKYNYDYGFGFDIYGNTLNQV